jgi:hypothetical protein
MVRPAPTGLERAAERGALTEIDDAGLALVCKRPNLVGRIELLDFETGHYYLLSLLVQRNRSSRSEETPVKDRWPRRRSRSGTAVSPAYVLKSV